MEQQQYLEAEETATATATKALQSCKWMGWASCLNITMPCCGFVFTQTGIIETYVLQAIIFAVQ